MIRCPACSSEIADSARFCPSCGEAVSVRSASQLPTGLATPSVARAAARRPVSSQVGRLASSDAGGFTPGTILAERYRIIGLIGRGGMGEVYRADDLKLGQPVALKFLPRHLSDDARWRERFYAEVRLARQVSHPNVCRVHDVGEIDGQQYLSMEYVDGEDLASLLKRIGRLPADKALEIARELCAGLAAAHERSVLHRDLKPANVMLDGRGRVRITDFGLAVAAEDAADGEISGTPAYMAPEQLAGKGATVRSDVYALGLVLYELSTGRKAFDGASFQELRRKHAEDTPTLPSLIAPGFDPEVERVILRCLEKDPAARPASAAQVAAALPGGDPLAAALAAGETPSPDMVAAAGERGAIAPATARRLLAGLAAALLLAVYFTPRANVVHFAGVDKSPEILRERAREILQTVGVGKPADSANWFSTNNAFLRWAQGHGGLGGDVSRDALTFVYRQSPEPLVAPLAVTGPYPTPMVDSVDPAPVKSGMAEVWTDSRGRLLRLSVVPPEFTSGGAAPAETDWNALFRLAGLDPSRFAAVEPRRSPSHYATTRIAWEGPHPEHAGVTMRIEAASYLGQPVSFDWLGPWSRPDRWQRAEQAPVSDAPTGIAVGDLAFTTLLMLFFFGGALLARNNLRAGRGDRRGAFRLAGFIVILQMGMWLLGSHHVASPIEFFLFLAGFSNALGTAVVFWLLYLALEPFARRRWPQMLISWSRALSGRWRDPLVGRDLLVGAVVGTATSLLLGPARVLLPLRLGIPGPPPHAFDTEAPVNPGLAIAWLFSNAVYAIFWILGIVFLLVLARRFVRSGWIAGVIVGLIVTLVFVGNYLGEPAPGVTLALAMVSVGIMVATTVRFGVLAAIVAETCRSVFGYRVYSSDPSNWAFYAGMIAVALAAALAWWAARTALAGRPLFGGASGLEE